MSGSSRESRLKREEERDIARILHTRVMEMPRRPQLLCALVAGALVISACGVDGRQPYATLVGPSTVPSTSSSLILVDSFLVIEFAYPSAAGYQYAPQLRVHEAGNGSGAVLTGLDFDIPGIGPAPPCRTLFGIGAGQTVDLFREIYGDYQYVISRQDARATGEDATATITVTDRRGANTKLTVTGKIVHGALPDTYTGGNPAWVCS